MEKLFIVALLLQEYQLHNPDDPIPKAFELLPAQEKIDILKISLKNKQKISDFV